MKIDLEQIRELLAVVGQTEITELTIEIGDARITIKKAGLVQTVVADVAPQLRAVTEAVAPKREPAAKQPEQKIDATPPPPPEPANSSNGLVPVTSPMVGTFYRSPSPTAPAFVDIGDRISVGQTVCIIEAMKLMNDMPSEVAGKIVKVCVDNGTTVEYGQQLFLVDPKG